MGILKRTCILFPVGPTNSLGYQILTSQTLDLLSSQFGHVFVFEGSIDSIIKEKVNVTSVSLGELINPTDENGNEFFSLQVAFLQQEFATNYIKLFDFNFVIQVHCNQYFTINQLKLLKIYLIYMQICHRPWGWIGKKYQVKTFKSKTIKKIPWILNLKQKQYAIYQPDQIKFKNRTISAKYVFRFPHCILSTWAPSLTDILFEYNQRDLEDRFHYYYNRMGKYESIEKFIESLYLKFSKFTFKKYRIQDASITQFLNCYKDDSLANSFIKKFLEKN